MMVIAGLLKPSTPSSTRSRESKNNDLICSSTANTPSQTSSEVMLSLPCDQPYDLYIRDEGHLRSAASEEPDLRSLNNSLVALAAIFPDVQVEVFREMLALFDEESRLAVVTETLLKHQTKWVRGRYRVALQEVKQHTEKGKVYEESDAADSRSLVPEEEKFRSAEYKKTAKGLLYHEFKGLSKSTINAVLAEFNHSYTLARPTLVNIAAKSWRYSLSSIFLRRKTFSLEAEHHPLIIWQSTCQGSITPSFKTTMCPELDRELFDSLIVPIRQRMALEKDQKDHSLALELNNSEAEENNALHDCECCFTATAFEELTACNDGGHIICFQCVRHALNEAVFGHGWQRNINLSMGTLRCLSANTDDCQGCIPPELVRRAFNEEKKNGQDILRKLDERLVEDSLLNSQLPLVRCPFCSYAEIDELYLPEAQRFWRLKRIGFSPFFFLLFLSFGVCMIPFFLPLFLMFSLFFVLVYTNMTFNEFIISNLRASITRLHRNRLGLKFVCQSKICGRASCISCSKAWTDIHVCHESSLLALRTQVELAMSLAIKRTCPRCNTSFVKSSGCNKLTCVCGYQMCYVCRKDIGNGEGYRHFCEHFRPNGGRGCTECSKCDLYKCENDEVVVKKAKLEAERQWMQKEGRDIVGDAKGRKVLENEWRKDGAPSWVRQWELCWPDWEALLDKFVEAVIE